MANTAQNLSPDDEQIEAQRVVDTLLSHARIAQQNFANASQQHTDEAVTALAWSLYKSENAKKLAELAVEDTGLGNVEDKITKNTRKTFGTLRDLSRVKSVGIIEELPELGLVKYAKPVGVVAAVTPSTNPAATPVNKAMMAIKGRNAIIIAPSPAGLRTTTETVNLMRAGLAKVGAPENLVQVLPSPVNKATTNALMRSCDLSVVTGSQNNVKSAYSSGKPAIGVGVGNVCVIIDSTADLDDAALKICQSKTFDNSTSCSSENSIIIVDDVYDQALTALKNAGGYHCSANEKKQVQEALWKDGKLNRHLIAKDANVFAKNVGLGHGSESAKFFMVDETGIGDEYPFSDEKLALVLSVYRASDFDNAKIKLQEMLNYKGRGHSCGIHTKEPQHATELAQDLEVVRVLLNQAHTFGNGGGFNTGLPFTLSMGCGTWGGNSISENLNYKHFLNTTHLVTSIEEDKPSEDELFGEYWKKYGQ